MEQETRTRKRVALYGSIATIVLFFAFPVLAVATPVLDGVAGGVGVFYLVAIVELFGATIAAMVFNRWMNRVEDR